VCASLCINFCYCRDQELAKVVIKKEEVELIVSYVALDQTEQTSTSIIIPAVGETLNCQCYLVLLGAHYAVARKRFFNFKFSLILLGFVYLSEFFVLTDTRI